MTSVNELRPAPAAEETLLRVMDLGRDYAMDGETVHTLRGVDLAIERGEYIASPPETWIAARGRRS